MFRNWCDCKGVFARAKTPQAYWMRSEKCICFEGDAVPFQNFCVVSAEWGLWHEGKQRGWGGCSSISNAANMSYGVSQRSIWVAPKDVLVVQVFLHHTEFTYRSISMKCNCFKQLDTYSVHCSLRSNVLVELYRWKAVLTYECWIYGVHIEASIISPSNAAAKVFTSQAVAKNENIGYYYGTLVYKNMEAVQKQKTIYGENIMAATTNQFKRSATVLATKVESLDNRF